MIMRRFAIVVLTFLVQTTCAQNAPVGVLIGVQSSGSDSALGSRPSSGGSLRTIWIPLDQSAATSLIEVLEIPDLLVPRRSGFWRAGLLGTCTEHPVEDIDGRFLGVGASVADHLWAAPVGSRPQVRLTDPEERVGSCITPRPRCENDGRTMVHWVWPEYVSLDIGPRSECGVHPDWIPTYTVRSLDSLDRPLAVTDVLGAAAEGPFISAFQNGEREFRAASANQCEAHPLEWSSWYIERNDGQWKTIGWNKAHRLCGYGFDFEAGLDLPGITGRTNDAFRWNRIKARMPQIADAHFSPLGTWVLVATDTQLMILPNADSTEPVVTLPLSQSERMVMVEWATGRNVSRWNDEVRRVRAAGRTEPVVRRGTSGQ